MPVKAPFSGPWLRPEDSGKIRYRGPAAVALKRTISRGYNGDDGKPLIPWRYFNNAYNSVLEDAVRKVQRKHGLQVTGTTGERLFDLLRSRRVPRGRPNAGDFAMDHVSVGLFEDAYDIKHPPVDPPLVRVREAMAEYLELMEEFDTRWDYSQARPYSGLGRAPSAGGYADCSALVMLAYYWARQHSGTQDAPAVHVPDPSGYGYSGYGNSQSIWDQHRDRQVSGTYEIGDVAIYGPSWDTRHVTICRLRGSSSTAIFTSNGSQPGPDPTRVFYRTDFLAVVRPPKLPT